MSRPLYLAFVFLAVLWPRGALAGMPSLTFTDVARLRLEVVSFFVMGLLISAGVVMVVWNSLRRDFVALPRLNYAKACGLVVLWGLLFVVVLTMISGARELMTPGAWEKLGVTYKLRESKMETDEPSSEDRDARRSRLYQLAGSLIRHSMANQGRYPDSTEELVASDINWQVPGFDGTRYVLVPGRTRDGPPAPLAYEPEIYEGKHFVLMTTGTIDELAFEQILTLRERSQ